MVILILDIVGGADTADQGMAAFNHIRDAMQKSGDVTVSFAGLQTATSSFVNMAFVSLLKHYTFDYIKQHLRVVQSSRQINDMIKSRLEREALATA
jgi:hypothetical protein